MEYGRTLIEFRAKHNLTQAQLANVLDVNPGMIHRYETGKASPSEMHKVVYAIRMNNFERSKKNGSK